MQNDIVEIKFFQSDALFQLQKEMNDFITKSNWTWKIDGQLAILGGQYTHTLIRVSPQDD